MLMKQTLNLYLPLLLTLVSISTVAQELTKETTDYEVLNQSTIDSFVMTEEKTTNDSDVDGLIGVNPQIESVWLVDADADVVIGEITDGQVFDRTLLPPNLTVMVEANAATESVQFGYGDALVVQTENGVPYAIGADSGGDYNAYPLPDGWHTVRARPFAVDGAGGSYGDEVLISFAIFEDGIVVDPSLDLDVAAPGRYQINEDTVYDNQTGLEWQRGTSDVFDNYSAAHNYCATLSLSDKGGWRVPEFLELHSIVDYREQPPGPDYPDHTIDVTAFPDTWGSYWSSTTVYLSGFEHDVSQVVIDFYFGDVELSLQTSSSNRVRCVRGGNGLKPAFDINADGTVTDKNHALIWQRNIEGGLNSVGSFEGAVEYCDNLELAGRTEWRVPSVHEMALLFDFRHRFVMRYESVFPNNEGADQLWVTNQERAHAYNAHYQIHFEASNLKFIESTPVAGAGHYVRCVHSAD